MKSYNKLIFGLIVLVVIVIGMTLIYQDDKPNNSYTEVEKFEGVEKVEGVENLNSQVEANVGEQQNETPSIDKQDESVKYKEKFNIPVAFKEEIIIEKEEALEKMKGKLDNEKLIFIDLDEYGGYEYSFDLGESADSENVRVYIVNPYNGNVYDHISEALLFNIIIDNYDIIDEVEILNMAKSSMFDNLAQDILIGINGFYQGDMVLYLYKKNESDQVEEVMKYRVDSITADVFDMSKENKFGNLLGN